jgi:hypothetical protein
MLDAAPAVQNLGYDGGACIRHGSVVVFIFSSLRRQGPDL